MFNCTGLKLKCLCSTGIGTAEFLYSYIPFFFFLPIICCHLSTPYFTTLYIFFQIMLYMQLFFIFFRCLCCSLSYSSTIRLLWCISFLHTNTCTSSVNSSLPHRDGSGCHTYTQRTAAFTPAGMDMWQLSATYTLREDSSPSPTLSGCALGAGVDVESSTH